MLFRSFDIGLRIRCTSVAQGLEKWSGWPDSNRRPPDPQSGALTRLRYIPSSKVLNSTPGSGSVLARLVRFPGENCSKIVPEPRTFIRLVPKTPADLFAARFSLCSASRFICNFGRTAAGAACPSSKRSCRSHRPTARRRSRCRSLRDRPAVGVWCGEIP